MNLQMFEKWEKNLFEIVDISNSLTTKIQDKYCFKKIFKLNKIASIESNFSQNKKEDNTEYIIKESKYHNNSIEGKKEFHKEIFKYNKRKINSAFTKKHDISSVFDKNSINAKAVVTDSTNHTWNFNLMTSNAWAKFSKKVKEKQKEIANKFGLNYYMNISVKANNRKNENDIFKENDNFPGIESAWHDQSGTTGDNKMAVTGINLKYFDFKVDFIKYKNDNSIVSNANKKLKEFVELIDSNNPSNIIEIDKNAEEKIMYELKWNDELKNKLLKIKEKIVKMTSTSFMLIPFLR